MNIRSHSSLIRFTSVAYLPIVFWLHSCQPACSQTSPPQSDSPASESASAKTQSKPSTKPTAVTTVDPNVTQAHLKLLVKPLTTDELIVEANAWQALLKANVQHITRLHIRIENLTAGKSALQKRGPPSQATGAATGDTSVLEEHPPNPTNPSQQTPLSPQRDPVASVTEQQATLSDQLTTLTIENSDISQKLEIVLASLELKGGDPTSYRKYINAINGVALEVSSVSGLWRMFTTWLVAEQGGKHWAWNLLRFALTLLVVL